MPELPDVETLKTYLNTHALEQPIAEVDLKNPRLMQSNDDLECALIGQAFLSSRRYGKYLIIPLSGGATLILHFGLHGGLKYLKPKAKPVSYQLLLTFENGHQLAYTTLYGGIVLTKQPEQWLKDKHLGPDALDMTLPQFKEQLSHGNASIKSTLLHQDVLAGIGNVYADEILFQAKVHPKTPVRKLPNKTVKRLHKSSQEVLKTAIKAKGRWRALPKTYLTPHRRNDLRCPLCGKALDSIKIDSRTTVFCDHCQGLAS